MKEGLEDVAWAFSWGLPVSVAPADPCSGPLAREDHPDLIQNAKKSDIPEKPKTPQQLWYTHEKKVYLKVRPDEIMRDYIQKHPELNISEEGITKSTLTKAERQLKDKFDGRPTKPPP